MRNIAMIAALAALTAGPALAEDKCPTEIPLEPFTEAFLADPINIEAGKEMWLEQCTHCHGKKAYPGKAPKLKPRRYKSGFVYRRVACGFRKMPAWWEVYEDAEIKQIEAFVLQGKLP